MTCLCGHDIARHANLWTVCDVPGCPCLVFTPLARSGVCSFCGAASPPASGHSSTTTLDVTSLSSGLDGSL